MNHRTDEELKQIARDIYAGNIFTDGHCQSAEEIPMVFMVFGLMEAALIKEIQADPPGMIFEYMDKAGPRFVNGLPSFLSMQMLSQEDTKKVQEMYEKIKTGVESALKT